MGIQNKEKYALWAAPPCGSALHLFDNRVNVAHWPRAAALLSPGRPAGDALDRCETAARHTAGRPGWRDAGRTSPPSAHTAEISLRPDHLRAWTHTHKDAQAGISPSSQTSYHWDRIQSEARTMREIVWVWECVCVSQVWFTVRGEEAGYHRWWPSSLL